MNDYSAHGILARTLRKLRNTKRLGGIYATTAEERKISVKTRSKFSIELTHEEWSILGLCYCHTCEKEYHSLGIARHRAMQRDNNEDCVIEFTDGTRYKYTYSEE